MVNTFGLVGHLGVCSVVYSPLKIFQSFLAFWAAQVSQSLAVLQHPSNLEGLLKHTLLGLTQEFLIQ